MFTPQREPLRMIDPRVPLTAQGTQNALKSFVSRGSYFYVAGEISIDKAPALAARFHERYRLDRTVSMRDHARRAGKCVFTLIMFPSASSRTIHWWLLRTEGHHPLLSMERWRDARSDRIEWPWLFELVQLPVDKPLREKYKTPDGRFRIKPQTWTWRMTSTAKERYKTSIRHWVQQPDSRINQLIVSLARCPGHRGVRKDVFDLYAYISRQCTMRKVGVPDIPLTIRWTRGGVGRCLPLSSLVEQVRCGGSPWLSSGNDVSNFGDTAYSEPNH